MDLFIQIRNGQPFEHPIFEDNFKQAFPNIDSSILPESFARFVRVAAPVAGAYEVYEGATYEWQEDLVIDVHHLRAMTPEEKTAKQQGVKENWPNFGPASWTFNETLCQFVAPIERPTDGKPYRWDEPTISWVEVAQLVQPLEI